MMKLKSIDTARPTSMPLRARRALQAANRRRGRSGRRRGRQDPARKRQRLEAYARKFMADARRWKEGQKPTSRPRSTRDVPAMIQRMKESVHREPEARFLAYTGAVPVPDFLVAEAKRETAARAAARAARMLGTSVPDIRWLQPRASGKQARGWYDERLPGMVWIRADLSPREIPGVVAHEAAHRADHLQGRTITEAAAEEFAAKFTQPAPRGATINRQTTWLYPNQGD